MGAINCCVDASAVDQYAHSSAAECPGLASHEESVVKESLRDGDESHTCSSSGSSTPAQEPTLQTPTATEILEESTKTQRRPGLKRQSKQKKLTERKPSCSLVQVSPKTVIRLSDYLCPCDPCPHSQQINRLLESILSSQDPASDSKTQDTVGGRTAIHRVLRGYATFDERRELDEAVVMFVKQLLVNTHGDEDQAFRQLIVHKYQPMPAVRRGSAVTA